MDRKPVGHDEIAFRVTSEDSGGALLALEVWMPAGGGPPMLHRHEAFELYRVERGEMTVYLADDDGDLRRQTATAGTVVPIPGGREHTIRNETAHEAHAFVVFTPGEQMERFARAAVTAAGPEDVLAAARANGIETTRPIGRSAAR